MIPPPAPGSARSMLAASAVVVLGALGSGRAAAGVAIEPQEIFSPFDEAVVTVEWGEIGSRFSGILRWANPADPRIGVLDTNLFDLDTVAAGDRAVLPARFSRGQELILGFAERPDGAIVSTFKDADLAAMVNIAARSPQEYFVYERATSGPDGQSTFMDNATIIVRFAQLPSPGTGVFIGTLLLVASRRR